MAVANRGSLSGSRDNSVAPVAMAKSASPIVEEEVRDSLRVRERR